MKDYIISKEQIDNAVKALKELENDSDTEQAHVEADEILLSLLPTEIQEEFNKLHKWYA